MNMTPMIDVVFLLIIFFMTISQASKTNKEHIDLPELKAAEDQRPSMITVNVGGDGRVLVSSREVSVAELVSLVAAELGRLDNDPYRLTMVIRADRQGPSRAVNQIVRAMAGLDVKQVRIAVRVPDA